MSCGDAMGLTWGIIHLKSKIKKLEKELQALREENETLKKARIRSPANKAAG